MNFGFNFGLLGGAISAVTANIIYAMNLASFSTTATGYQTLDNTGSDGETHDAESNAGNMVHQNGTDNNVAVPITESVTQTLLYLSPITREFVLVTSLSGSTHDLDVSFGELLTMTALATSADIVKLNADHNLLRKIFFHGFPSPLSFDRDDMLLANGGHYYPANEGSRGDEYIGDMANPPSPIILTGIDTTNYTGTPIVGGFNLAVISEIRLYFRSTYVSEGNVYINFNAQINSGSCTLNRWYDGSSWHNLTPTVPIVNGANYIKVGLNSQADNLVNFDITSSTFDIDFTDLDIYDNANDIEIENFVVANRTTYENEDFGATDRIVKKDSTTGRTTDGADDGDAEYHGSGGDTIPTRTRTADITIELTPRVVESILLVDTATGDITMNADGSVTASSGSVAIDTTTLQVDTKSIVTITGISIDGESTIFNDFDGVVHNYEENEV